uniref:NADH-ubiquinone oxidoreductase chain 4L n=1 Tax=Ricinus sp. ADS-2020 TaxID=2794903 RepID=A0A7T1M871_9NEOP|nr:NADH dehydrogenase subunit 4L [Ricinus sp. ADS-2020]
MMNLFIIFLFSGLIKLEKSKSLVSCILSIEMISGSAILLSCLTLMEVESNFMIILLMSFFVLESVLGLSIFIFVSRNSGNDSLKSINLLKY